MKRQHQSWLSSIAKFAPMISFLTNTVYNLHDGHVIELCEQEFKVNILTLLVTSQKHSDSLRVTQQHNNKLTMSFKKWRIKTSVTKSKNFQFSKCNQTDCEHHKNFPLQRNKSQEVNCESAWSAA